MTSDNYTDSFAGDAPSALRVCKRFRVRGKVQGVWFRESTRREACRLGLQGQAVNLPDGSVEVIAAGGRTELAQLAAWLQHGPPLAWVEHLDEEIIADPGLQGFETR